MTVPASDILLEVSDLKVHFPAGQNAFGRARSMVHAVDGVSFAVKRGSTFVLVGESGSGKTTTALASVRLVEPTSGQVLLMGDDITRLGAEELRLRRRHMQFVFQDPYASLNPRERVGDIVRRPLDLMSVGSRSERRARVDELFALVGLRKEHQQLFPHQFSGGQRQRIGIARALATRPELVVCDEPVSALDVAIQAQILNLLMRLKYEFGLTYVFISHDLAVVQHVCDEIAVMYLGRIVERGDRRQIFSRPGHPYTLALLSAAPGGETDTPVWGPRIKLQGDPPSPINIAAGCRFAGRCPFVLDQCRSVEPELRDIGAGHAVACHRIGADGRREFG